MAQAVRSTFPGDLRDCVKQRLPH